jgi:glycosyltransferase involved in cell wall biosynthesis
VNERERRLNRPVVAVVGPLPPPLHGHMVVTERVLSSKRLAEDFELVHVDLSDHRGLDTIGRFDFANLLLALRHVVGLVAVLVRRRPSLVYLPLAQNRLGLLRDFALLAPALVARCRVVAHVHGGGFGAFLGSSPAWFRRPAVSLLRRCSGVVVMSEWQARSIDGLFPRDKISIVRHGTRSMEAERAEAPEHLRVLFVCAGIVESKGVFDALEAAAIVEREGLPFRWTFVGTWLHAQERVRGESIARRLKSVSFVGALTSQELRQAYENSDVLVFPPGEIEGFGLVRIEAMAAGLPVVTTEAGGAREIIRDGIDGFVVGYGASDEIVDRLKLLHADPKRRLEMGRAAEARQREVFTIEAFEESLAGAWSSVLRQRAAA